VGAIGVLIKEMASKSPGGILVGIMGIVSISPH
jgi:hypothetical protein